MKTPGFGEAISWIVEANADKGIVGVISSTIIGTAADYASGAVMSFLGQGEALGRWAGGCGSLSEAVMDGAGIALNVAGGFSIASTVRAGTEGALARAIGEGAACFPAGTLVEMADGSSKPIEEIKNGDRVMTRPQWADGQAKAEAGLVIQTLKRESTELIFVKFASGATLEATGNHPFYVQDFGFVEAERLQVGSRVSTNTGESQRIEAIVRLPISAPVYNFTVARTHTYFVGRPNSWLWVHNARCGPGNWFHDHHIFPRGEANKIIQAQSNFSHPAFHETVPIPAEFHREFVHTGGGVAVITTSTSPHQSGNRVDIMG